jgi:hypothetical protein
VADAVAGLCRSGAPQAPPAGVAPEDHIEVWLIDRDDADLDLPGVLANAAAAVRDLRSEGRTVLLHCASGRWNRASRWNPASSEIASAPGRYADIMSQTFLPYRNVSVRALSDSDHAASPGLSS